jgi:hypothetical protein
VRVTITRIEAVARVVDLLVGELPRIQRGDQAP